MADKEVRFDLYCKTCAYEENDENDSPCDECLMNGSNEDSHKPIRWKRKDNPQQKHSS